MYKGVKQSAHHRQNNRSVAFIQMKIQTMCSNANVFSTIAYNIFATIDPYSRCSVLLVFRLFLLILSLFLSLSFTLYIWIVTVWCIMNLKWAKYHPFWFSKYLQTLRAHIQINANKLVYELKTQHNKKKMKTKKVKTQNISCIWNNSDGGGRWNCNKVSGIKSQSQTKSTQYKKKKIM